MNLAELLKFVPLAIGLMLAYHLVMREGLPKQNLGKILSYFLGVLIIFTAITWLINTFFASWANELLQSATTSADLQQLIITSEDIIDDAFSPTGSSANPVPVNTQNNNTLIQVTPTPNVIIVGPESAAPESSVPASGVHEVVTGDTLFGIAQKYGTTVDDLMRANGLTSYIIQPGQKLTIPGK